MCPQISHAAGLEKNWMNQIIPLPTLSYLALPEFADEAFLQHKPVRRDLQLGGGIGEFDMELAQ